MTAEKTEQQLEDIKDLINLKPKDWRRWVNKQFNKICNHPKEYGVKRNESYESLEQKAKCNLKTRLRNKKDRARENGVSKTQVNQLNNLDVINDDVRLKEIYIGIIKDMGVKYVSWLSIIIN